MAKREITNQDLAKSINDLAISVKKGFDGVDKRFRQVDKRFDGVDSRFDRVENRLKALEQGQEEIKLSLTNVAYRFELEELARSIKLLTKRVNKLESKA